MESFVWWMTYLHVFGEMQTEHDNQLLQVLRRLEKVGLTLNREKCQFNRKSIKFLGQVVDETGVHPHPDKISAIKCMSPPMTVTELCRFLGIANQMSKFSPHLTGKTKPLRDLLSTKNTSGFVSALTMSLPSMIRHIKPSFQLMHHHTD